MPQHTNIKKRIKFTTEYEKNNTNGKHLHHHFLLLFALKPLLQSSNLYWCAIYILFGVGFIAQTSTIINGFRRKLFPQKQIKTLNTTLYIMPFISTLGIFISFKYDHSFLTFWIFMLILNALHIAVRHFLKPKNRS